MVDIGCGDGHFLELLCQKGSNQGLGIDPSASPESTLRAVSDAVEIVSSTLAAFDGQIQTSLICCRHVLEHVVNPRDFLQEIKSALVPGSDPVFYFEVPNVRHTLDGIAIWDLIYEHCSYYSEESLSYLFEAEGFEIVNISESYGGQFLSLEARLRPDGESGRSWNRSSDRSMAATVAGFGVRFAEKVESWKRLIDRQREAQKKTVIWGAGSKGVTVLNMLGIHDVIDLVVDLNPKKHGKYIPGTGQQVVSPEFLNSYQPDTVLVMNELYSDEISQQLKEMGLSAEVLVP